MVGVNRRTDLSRLNHLRAASLKDFLSKADGARPLQRGAMLVVFFCSVTTTKAITRNKRFVPASES